MEYHRMHALGSTHIVERDVNSRFRNLLQFATRKSCDANGMHTVSIRPLDRAKDIRTVAGTGNGNHNIA